MTELIQAAASAPASIANLEVGFDVLGLALAQPTDRVTVHRIDTPGVAIRQLGPGCEGLPRTPGRNTAAIAATAVLEKAQVTDFGVAIELEKGLPVCSGLGSSSASAVAAAVAVHRLLGETCEVVDLLMACLEAEAAVSGAHLDNAAASLLGGLIMVRSLNPLQVSRVPLPAGLRVAVVLPEMQLSTHTARQALPTSVSLHERTRASAALAAFVQACTTGDLDLLAQTPIDPEVHPQRAAHIPGCDDALAAAREAGALLAGISGAGPALFGLCPDEPTAAAVQAAMVGVFLSAGVEASGWTCAADNPGALDL